ncbi:dihydrolipoamide acetyltransferase component [Rothia aeria]|uniref:Dihydrolipoamide acetyltransferase component n=1 Tax=Rothia aeria TaxID=172042 RepID=A0A2Z5QVT4_9MICC|nr:dihydrolipoamide acetyltransferase component [Rothia aeria]
MSQIFNLPDVGEGLTEAEILAWKVAPGDTVHINDVLVEIETAKSVVELPSPYEGSVEQLLAAEGDTVEVGTPIIAVAGSSESAGSSAPPHPALIPVLPKHPRRKPVTRRSLVRAPRQTRLSAVPVNAPHLPPNRSRRPPPRSSPPRWGTHPPPPSRVPGCWVGSADGRSGPVNSWRTRR